MIIPEQRGPVHILLIEDNEADIRLTKEVFAESSLPTRITVARDGEQALAALRGQDRYLGVGRVDLVLLDLNLPRRDGREVLAEIRADPALADLPVIVLTTSRSEQDIARTYQLHANSYVCKPVDLPQFIEAVKTIEDFWLKLARLPRGGDQRRGAAQP